MRARKAAIPYLGGRFPAGKGAPSGPHSPPWGPERAVPRLSVRAGPCPRLLLCAMAQSPARPLPPPHPRALQTPAPVPLRPRHDQECLGKLRGTHHLCGVSGAEPLRILTHISAPQPQPCHPNHTHPFPHPITNCDYTHHPRTHHINPVSPPSLHRHTHPSSALGAPTSRSGFGSLHPHHHPAIPATLRLPKRIVSVSERAPARQPGPVRSWSRVPTRFTAPPRRQPPLPRVSPDSVNQTRNCLGGPVLFLSLSRTRPSRPPLTRGRSSSRRRFAAASRRRLVRFTNTSRDRLVVRPLAPVRPDGPGRPSDPGPGCGYG